MTRSDVVNQLLQLFNEPRYLEIGVNRGETFFAIRAKEKIAVDPVFLFDVAAAREADKSASFYEVTSDAYFSDVIDPSEKFDVIYLDGLHTFEQTLRDLTNAMRYLTPKGVVLIDDVVPTNYHASLPRQSDAMRVKAAVHSEDNSWMGDTYKLVFFIHTFFPSLNYRTITDNHGQTVVWRARQVRRSFKDVSVAEIGNLEFLDVISNPDIFEKAELVTILGELSRELAGVEA